MKAMTFSSPWIRPLLVAGLLLGTLACSNSGGGSSPTAPVAPLIVLESASVSVDGQNVTNGTWNHGGHSSQSTRFEATLTVDGRPAIGEMVYIDYDRPQGMGSMMGMNGRFRLYDDGTHGDHTPGDGLYCLEDFNMGYGFHHGDSAHGEYHYDYFGQDHQGYESNHMQVSVQVGN